jgi:hypothetical protein
MQKSTAERFHGVFSRLLVATLAGHFDRLYSHVDAHRLPPILDLHPFAAPLESYFFERVPEATISWS